MCKDILHFSVKSFHSVTKKFIDFVQSECPAVALVTSKSLLMKGFLWFFLSFVAENVVEIVRSSCLASN